MKCYRNMGVDNGGLVLMDGGHDTELRKYVGDEFDGHPLWICRYLVENPKLLQKVYHECIEAGSETILTNTYQATVDGFKKYLNLNREEAIQLIKSSVKLVQEVIKEKQEKGLTRHVAVVGTVGPYGAYLHDGSEYAGGFYVDDMTTEELVEWHRPRVEALLDAGVDYLLFGTIPSLKEAEALIILIKERPGTKAIMSFSAQNEEKISHGEKLSEAAQRVWDLGSGQLIAVGVNCLHPRLTLPLLRSVKQAAPHIPLFVKPNTTEVFNTTTKQWEWSDDGITLSDYCRSYLQMGVKYISGCCRTSCKDIADFRREIQCFTHKA